MYTALQRIVLGSASPRRRDLLALAGFPIEVRPTDVPEEARAGETPRDHTLRLAREKAIAASRGAPGTLAIGADTIVVLGDAVLEKPRDEDDALRMLLALAGRSHDVLTGWAVARDGNVLASDVTRTEVEFRAITEREARSYIATGEPFDKAGAYGIQGQGAVFVRGLRGSYTNVVGLPLVEVLDALARLGAIA